MRIVAFDDRLGYLFLGMIIGFVLGYLVRLTREIKEELDEVDEIVKKEFGNSPHDRDQGGFMRVPWTANIAVLLVVVLTAYASFVSQKTSNTVKATQETQTLTIYCTEKVLDEAIKVLNERTVYSGAQSAANIDLQKDFSRFFNLILHQPPYSSKKRLQAALDYQESLNTFLALTTKQREKAENNPFPAVKELDRCLANGGN
jgi:hypothetical protein